MENLEAQRATFDQLMKLVGVTEEERQYATRGLELFLEQGWPSRDIKVGMAVAAGKGLLPFPYKGIESYLKYRQMMAQSLA